MANFTKFVQIRIYKNEPFHHIVINDEPSSVSRLCKITEFTLNFMVLRNMLNFKKSCASNLNKKCCNCLPDGQRETKLWYNVDEELRLLLVRLETDDGLSIAFIGLSKIIQSSETTSCNHQHHEIY